MEWKSWSLAPISKSGTGVGSRDSGDTNDEAHTAAPSIRTGQSLAPTWQPANGGRHLAEEVSGLSGTAIFAFGKLRA